MGSENGNTSMENITTINSDAPSIVDNNISVTFGALILSIVFLLGVPGNLFIIWSILARARKRSVTTLLIFNLACADGCLMCLTIFFIIYLAKQNWIFGGVMCKMLFYLCNTNMYASIMIIMLMSLHRLVAVVWPTYLTACTRKRTVLSVLGGLWIVVFFLALPALIYRKERTEKGRTVCATKRSQHVVFQYTLETVVGFLVPYVIIVSSYVCILRRLRQTRFKRRIRSGGSTFKRGITNPTKVCDVLKILNHSYFSKKSNNHILCLSPDWMKSGSPAVLLHLLWLLSVVVPILSSTPLPDAPTSKLKAWHSWPDYLRAQSWTMVPEETRPKKLSDFRPQEVQNHMKRHLDNK